MSKTKTPALVDLINAAEARATCRTGMAHARRNFVVRLDGEDAMALGVHPRLNLTLGQGSYALSYTDNVGGHGEIAWEPAEPDAQERAERFARRNPIGAALELLNIDKQRIADRAAA